MMFRLFSLSPLLLILRHYWLRRYFIAFHAFRFHYAAYSFIFIIAADIDAIIDAYLLISPLIFIYIIIIFITLPLRRQLPFSIFRWLGQHIIPLFMIIYYWYHYFAAIIFATLYISFIIITIIAITTFTPFHFIFSPFSFRFSLLTLRLHMLPFRRHIYFHDYYIIIITHYYAIITLSLSTLSPLSLFISLFSLLIIFIILHYIDSHASFSHIFFAAIIDFLSFHWWVYDSLYFISSLISSDYAIFLYLLFIIIYLLITLRHYISITPLLLIFIFVWLRHYAIASSLHFIIDYFRFHLLIRQPLRHYIDIGPYAYIMPIIDFWDAYAGYASLFWYYHYLYYMVYYYYCHYLRWHYFLRYYFLSPCHYAAFYDAAFYWLFSLLLPFSPPLIAFAITLFQMITRYYYFRFDYATYYYAMFADILFICRHFVCRLFLWLILWCFFAICWCWLLFAADIFIFRRFHSHYYYFITPDIINIIFTKYWLILHYCFSFIIWYIYYYYYYYLRHYYWDADISPLHLRIYIITPLMSVSSFTLSPFFFHFLLSRHASFRRYTDAAIYADALPLISLFDIITDEIIMRLAVISPLFARVTATAFFRHYIIFFHYAIFFATFIFATPFRRHATFSLFMPLRAMPSFALD